jgi:hypothetical protein
MLLGTLAILSGRRDGKTAAGKAERQSAVSSETRLLSAGLPSVRKTRVKVNSERDRAEQNELRSALAKQLREKTTKMDLGS